MKTLLNFALIVLASFSLVACSYFDSDDELSLDSAPPGETIDLTQDQTMTAPDMPQSFEPPPRIEDVINNSSKGSVQMYSPDAPPLQPATGVAPTETYSFGDSSFQQVDTVSAVPVDRPMPSVISMDPSVEVFPLDGPVQGSGPAMAVVNASTGDAAVIYFGRSETKLDGEDDGKVAVLAKGPVTGGVGVTVQGFASTESTIQDPVKRKIANLKVSLDRAFSVARALIEQGVPAEMITTVAHGENRPGATPETSRRVEIHGISGH